MAKTVHVTWVQKVQFVGSDSSKYSVVMPSQDEEDETGMKPPHLLLVGLGGRMGPIPDPDRLGG